MVFILLSKNDFILSLLEYFVKLYSYPQSFVLNARDYGLQVLLRLNMHRNLEMQAIVIMIFCYKLAKKLWKVINIDR